VASWCLLRAEMGVAYEALECGAPRGSAINPVGRSWRHILALTCFAVSALLLVCPVAAAAEPEPTLPSAGGPPVINPPVADPTGQATAASQASADSELAEITIQAPEPRFAAPTLRDRIGRIWAPVLINGHGPYRLVLDTGATHSAIVPGVVDSLGIPISSLSNIRVTGVTGTAMVPTVAVKKFEFGELSVDPTVLPVVADVFGGAEGVLGTEGLSDKRIRIDFAHDTVVILRSRGSLDTAGVATLPLHQLRDHLLAMDIRVANVRAKAIIDTGAQISIGNNALREVLIRHNNRDIRKSEVEGVTLDVTPGDTMRAPPIYVGPLIFQGMSITYGDMYIFERWKLNDEPVLVLGMDVLGSVELLVIDYRLHQLQMRLRHSPGSRS
jgi:Aspartyl protease